MIKDKDGNVIEGDLVDLNEIKGGVFVNIDDPKQFMKDLRDDMQQRIDRVKKELEKPKETK